MITRLEFIRRVDGVEQPDVQPAPVTTIAWRLQNMAVDCLDSYSARAFDATGVLPPTDPRRDHP